MIALINQAAKEIGRDLIFICSYLPLAPHQSTESIAIVFHQMQESQCFYSVASFLLKCVGEYVGKKEVLGDLESFKKGEVISALCIVQWGDSVAVACNFYSRTLHTQLLYNESTSCSMKQITSMILFKQ